MVVATNSTAVLDAPVRRVRRTLDDAAASLVGRRVLGLCSGGADSVALVALLGALPRGAAPRSIDVLWLDHGLRADVDAERECAAFAATSIDAVLHVRRAGTDLRVDDGGVEAAARAWRYRTALDVAAELGCDVVATGHTADDQLELALLALVGVTGHAGRVDVMPVSRALAPDVALVRPLLALSRREIEDACSDARLRWCTDPSNLDADAHVRNSIRHRVVPTLLDAHPGAGGAITRAGERERACAEVTTALADALLDAWQSGDALDVRQLAPRAPAVRRELLAAWLRRAGLGRAITSRAIAAVDRLAVLPGRAACQRVDLAGGTCVRRDGYDLTIQPAPRHGGSQP